MIVIILLLSSIWFSPATSAEFVLLDVRNSASTRGLGVPRGGGLATIVCFGLEGEPGLLTAPPGGPLPFKLGGIELFVNGARAPILSVFIPPPEEAAAQRIEFQVPLERNSTPSELALPVVRQRGVTLNYWLLVPSSQPTFGAFIRDSANYLTAEHTVDGRRVTPEDPARPGETITVFAIDFFNVWPPPPLAVPVPAEPRFEFSRELIPADARVDRGYDRGNLYLQEINRDPSCRFCPTTAPLKILFQGLAAGKIGIQRIDFVVPTDQATGDWPLFFSVGDCPGGEGLCADPNLRSSEHGLLPVRQ